MDPATCRLPASRLQAAPLTACGSSGGGRVPEEEWGDTFHSKSSNTCDLPRGWHQDTWSWPALLATRLLRTVLLSSPRLVGRERGDLPPPCLPWVRESTPLAASYAAGEKSRTGTLDRIDLLQDLGRCLSLKDFFLF